MTEEILERVSCRKIFAEVSSTLIFLAEKVSSFCVLKSVGSLNPYTRI